MQLHGCRYEVFDIFKEICKLQSIGILDKNSTLRKLALIHAIQYNNDNHFVA
jgi:hypothetical protein